MSEFKLPDPAAAREAFAKDLPAAWSYFRRRHPGDVPYAFVLYGLEGSPRFTVHVLTEEGLTRVAERYMSKGHYGTLDEAREGLRYSVSDSPYVSEMLEQLPTVDTTIHPHLSAANESAGYELLANAAMDVLLALDKTGMFDRERERMMLIIITEDTETSWAVPSVRKLNPPSVAEQFEKNTRVEGTFARFGALAFARDGKSLYSVGSRKLPDASRRASGNASEFESEIIAFDFNGNDLKRRWTFNFPHRGDSARALAVAPDGKSIVVFRTQGRKTQWSLLLMRFPHDANKCMKEMRIPGEGASFAQSPEGSRIAVASHQKQLHLLDSEFTLLRSIQSEESLHDMRFLRDGALLIATDRGLQRLERDASQPVVCAPIPCDTVSVDDAEKYVAISRPRKITGGFRDNTPPDESEVTLLQLPSMAMVRTFGIPNHEVQTATLSPDGRLLAFEMHEIGRRTSYIAVFDVIGRREIARRRTREGVNDLVFLPNSRALAIAKSCMTTTEPIDIWPIREENSIMHHSGSS